MPRCGGLSGDEIASLIKRSKGVQYLAMSQTSSTTQYVCVDWVTFGPPLVQLSTKNGCFCLRARIRRELSSAMAVERFRVFWYVKVYGRACACGRGVEQPIRANHKV